MFGYVIPLKPELKIREYNTFRGYYCGICHEIKKNYGNIPRLSLNYDMTFLAIFLDGLCETKIEAINKRCISHPIKKPAIIYNNPAITYAASMNVSLSYYKILDDVNDDNNIKSKFLLHILSPYNKKFTKDILYINKIIEKELKRLSTLEKTKNFSSLDEICDPFSTIVGKILELYPNSLYNDSIDKRELLYKFGYTLGKWIYLIDALDDLEEDMKEGKFNPVEFLFNESNFNYIQLKNSIQERIEFNILNCAYNCVDIFNKLEFKKNKTIIENILSLGMMDKYLKVLNNIKESKKGSAFNEPI
ncbi:hypothetical protein KQI77_05890 [Clostridium sp. MSJ-8]|uniref:DUF5685 family protein n=1 Tax=Clostridium sp. MSJ-8 TaxID=2841510 RepID=UPI001C0F20F4|nr:DUF5685 family protein [Clostridium sp. MSJ-8]MBU5487697.1 hypothetical protein [Clostridium sp. MSJ-8]